MLLCTLARYSQLATSRLQAVSHLQDCKILTRGFHNPPSLVDDARYFDQTHSFYVALVVAKSTEARRVLYVGWEIDKRSLAYPFLGA
jgi:hypothetical protein